MTPTLLVAYLALFALVGFLFIFSALLLGWFLRGRDATTEKREIYECGEPAIGSGFVQFDLRFYVVALLFIIFDVEVAFFFPWATVFGKATQLADPNLAVVVNSELDPGSAQLSPAAAGRLEELGVPQPDVPERSAGVQRNDLLIREASRKLSLTALADISVFFGVLLVGFAYVWYRGDLDWVRAVTPRQAGAADQTLEEPADVRV